MRRTRTYRAAACLAVVLSQAGAGLAQKGAPAVTGAGTPGRVAKFTAASAVGDSVITENKFGQVGIGTDAPTSRLTVLGRVESLAGGFKFPDGSVQTSAGLAAADAVTSVNGLRGDVQISGSENIVVTPSGNTVVLSAAGLLTPDQAVTSLEGLRGDVTFTAGRNITITPTANTIIIDADAAAAVHDATLAGDGSAAAPLALAVPLTLRSGVASGAILTVLNDGGAGDGFPDAVIASGGNAAAGGFAGGGLRATGGDDDNADGEGGTGVAAIGGSGTGPEGRGGTGLFALAGLAFDGGVNGRAGLFGGDVSIGGDLDVEGATTRVTDHPLDPENKELRHAAVESSEMLNVYSGNVVTDAGGTAVVALPDWFDAVNSDVRYQLTVVGTFARAIVADEVRDNRFAIKTDAPNVKVSWQVTGVRSDAASKLHPFAAVADKPAAERGFYHAPEAFGKAVERGVLWARHGDLLRRARR